MVSEYQSSGVPFVTSSATNEVGTTTIAVQFPYVTRWVKVFNTDASSTDTLRVGFSDNGVQGTVSSNYIVLNGGQTTDMLELKCTAVYFRRHGSTNTSFSLAAGLTNVPAGSFFLMSGSKGVAGVG
jgi:hypothetical protein